jgi:CubicO group peptidase (beta-lactamase class C family)
MGRPPGYVAALDTPLVTAPGERFSYGAEPFQVFGELLRRKVASRNETPVDYVRRRILDPLGLNVGRWRTGVDGNPVMPSGAQLSAREWAKFGEFVRNGGRVGGKMIVDKAAFDAMFAGSAANPAYGITWWLSRDMAPALRASIPQLRRGTDVKPGLPGVPEDLVLAAGAGKQRLYVSAKEGRVVVRQSSRLLELPRAGEDEFSDAAFWATLRR